jgi:hypothetical protein
MPLGTGAEEDMNLKGEDLKALACRIRETTAFSGVS